MTRFTELPSHDALQTQAEHPIDLTAKGVFTPKRLEEFTQSALGLHLFYGAERVTEDVMGSLKTLASEANCLEKMQEMQNGDVINHIEGVESENRRVLHTAMRDFFDKRCEAKPAKEATELAYKELEKLREFLDKVDKEDITDLVQIGIGGSELGPKAIYMSLKAYAKPGRKVHFISNVDPDDVAAVMREVPLKKTLVVIVSKSGGTLETRTNEALVREVLKKEGLNPSHHLIAVTGKGSPMDDPSKYRASFYIWDYVGGRYSATSMVGCVSLAFALGMDKLLDFLRGASNMDKHALEPNNLPMTAALLGIWNRNFLKHPTCAIIPYSQAMVRFSAHLQQLDMESNGKRIDKQGIEVDFDTGPIIWGEPGTNGQHSFYQLIHQGTTPVPIEFIGFAHSQYGEDLEFEATTSQQKLLSNLFAQSIGLATGKPSDNPNKMFPGNRPNSLLLAKTCDPYTMGALLAYYEAKVAFQGFIWNVNSFDQEGVQLGKVLANQIIDIFGNSEAEPFPLGQFFVDKLKEL